MIIFNGKNSKTDFDLYIASVERPPATRKEITETVPYMSGLWDFSYHDGNVDEYEPIKIKYTFDVIADSKQELNALRSDLIAWVHSKGENRLIDTNVSDTSYYRVYHAQASWSEEGLQGLLTAEFTCYPFLLTEKKIFHKLYPSGTADVTYMHVSDLSVRTSSPIVRVMSKNLFDASKVPNNYDFINNGDGTFTIPAGRGVGQIIVSLRTLCPQLKVGDTAVLNFETTVPSGVSNWNYAYFWGIKKGWYKGEALTVTDELLDSKCSFTGNSFDKINAMTISNIQIELGETATAYEPYFEASASLTDAHTHNSFAVSAGEYRNLMTLKKGDNTYVFSGKGIVLFSYEEENL